MFQIITNGLYRFCEWITKLACLNLLWLMFTIAGLGVFGLFPSTTAMFTVTKKWLEEGEDVRLFKTFYHTFKEEFWRSNGLGIIITGISLIFYVDLKILTMMTDDAYYVGIPLLSLLIICSVILLYLFPVYVHYKGTYLQLFKNAFLISVAKPFHTFTLIMSVLGLSYIVFYHITIVLFFSGSLIALVMTGLCQKAFQSIEVAKSKYQHVS